MVIGWDIGGAHLKAARVVHGRVEAVAQAATPLWMGLDSLHAAFEALNTGDRSIIKMNQKKRKCRRVSRATSIFRDRPDASVMPEQRK